MVYTIRKSIKKEDFFMHEKRRHYRVALKEIKESPAEGIYVTNEELKKYGLFAGFLFVFLTIFAFFNRKG